MMQSLLDMSLANINQAIAAKGLSGDIQVYIQ
ncbi:hypothetical protein SVI_2402 [Shewanella violacea DSS12]|uniref:Uncharacterized protein n=1 Tax=Shewanella violacea (strain JCM 10179 / CIP 106290 / LMG 19151 / DSS12) TaxID=637905 RepID=D4ZL24_SHEVD|nr:hypothetical protein SVI_2402 [Shewanella violacea DSS12]